MKQHPYAAIYESLKELGTPEMVAQMGRVLRLYSYIDNASEFTAAIQGDQVIVMLPFVPRLVIGVVRTVVEFEELHARWHAGLDPLKEDNADPGAIAAFVMGILTRGEL